MHPGLFEKGEWDGRLLLLNSKDQLLLGCQIRYKATPGVGKERTYAYVRDGKPRTHLHAAVVGVDKIRNCVGVYQELVKGAAVAIVAAEGGVLRLCGLEVKVAGTGVADNMPMTISVDGAVVTDEMPEGEAGILDALLDRK